MTATRILIASAGIAGPTLAYWLHSAGFETTIVERAPALRAGGYVIDFWGLGYDIAVRMGLANDLESVGYHMREFRVVDAAGRPAAGFGPSAFWALAGERFVTLRRSDLSRMIFDRVQGFMETLFGDEIVGLDQRENEVRVRLGRAGERVFDLVIGADGLHSTVRRLAFGEDERFESELGYAVAAFEAEGCRPRDEGAYVVYNEPARMLGRVALRDDRTLFLFVFADDGRARSARTPGEQKAVLRERYGAVRWECGRVLDLLDEAPEVYFDAVSQIRMPNWWSGRVALVGDAAFCASLMAGQGSALAMTAAYVLAGEIAAARGRPEAAFQRYQARLRQFMATKQKAALRFSAAFAPRTRWGLVLRNLTVNACAVPAIAKIAFGRELVDALTLPDYEWPRERQGAS